jgi:hypothetical protein
MASREESEHKVPAVTPIPRVGVIKKEGAEPPEPTAELLEQAFRNAEKVPRRQPPPSSSPQ